MYNSLKACKGVMFFLPLPLENTLDTFDEVDNNVSLASPELYIIVNGKPTKTKVVWHSLVDVNEMKKAVQKLKVLFGFTKMSEKTVWTKLSRTW